MKILPIALTICNLLLTGYNVYCFLKISKQKENYDKEREQYKSNLQKKISDLNTEIYQKQEQKNELNLQVEKEKNLAKETIKNIKLNAQTVIQQCSINIEEYRNEIEQEKERLEVEIDKLKESLNAGIQARLREQEKKDKIKFYTISLLEKDIKDIQKLEEIKSSLNNPIVLSKLIWTQYFQKRVTELCDRILNNKKTCGIYKITNLSTNECYIGQSLDIANRIKSHCKCGLGINASATNTLYNNMQEYGLWEFSFELLEECPKELLNEKESFWINMYQSNIYGLNKTKGNK